MHLFYFLRATGNLITKDTHEDWYLNCDYHMLLQFIFKVAPFLCDNFTLNYNLCIRVVILYLLELKVVLEFLADESLKIFRYEENLQILL